MDLLLIWRIIRLLVRIRYEVKINFLLLWKFVEVLGQFCYPFGIFNIADISHNSWCFKKWSYSS